MTVTVGVVPKSTLNPYFQDCLLGAREAAQEQGFTLRWEGPREADADRQRAIVEEWTREGLPAIAVSVENRAQLSPILRDARARGIKVLTWDSDADPDARDFTVLSATPESIAHALSFEVGRILGGKGAFAAITSTLSAPNQNAWIAEFKARLAKDYPGLTLVEVRPCDDVADNARMETLKNLGYLVAVSAWTLASGTLEPGAVSLRAGRLGSVVIIRDEIRLGRCHIVSRGNIADFA